jgi:hypothetical protein
MHFFCIEWNRKAFGLNDETLGRNQFTVGTMELPRYLNYARPVGKIGEWSIPTAGQSGGFGIKNQEHDVGKLGCCGGRVDRPKRGFQK